METSAWYALLAPLFVALLAGEAAMRRRRGLPAFDLAEAASNLGCGVGQIAFGVLSGPVVLFLYAAFRARFAVVSWEGHRAAEWALAFVGVDLCYYAMHRANHRVRLLWATHAVHHQSERFDFSAALRQTWFSDLVALVYYWPLPLLGIGEVPFFGAVAALSVYQVVLHTELVGRPRSRLARAWALVFNTPSHHRVHHARSEGAAARNLGATLIVWDRVFGTFEPETVTVAYGTSPAVSTLDPVRAQFDELARMLCRPREVEGRVPLAGRRRALVVALLALLGAIAGGVLPATVHLSFARRLPWAIALFVGLVALGALLTGRARTRSSDPSGTRTSCRPGTASPPSCMPSGSGR